ncbi:5-hydroxytryptamine receptor 1E [Hoplias malabaricus]|uniref:5-hydroxytryptamine receptor 1E n=1 Tax=Hoplias malabaricus TaxID=27720 RepID=UPI003461D2C5
MERYLGQTSGTPPLPPSLNITNTTSLPGAEMGVSLVTERVAVVITLGVLTLLTAVVNGAVIAAIFTTRKLQLPANYLICSLAVTDLLVALLVMPPSVLYITMETWSLGAVACEVWLSVDVTCCTCSILHLCVIALDRYWAITKAVEYARKRTGRRAIIMVFSVWIISIFISVPPLFWRSRRSSECHIEHDQVGYSVYSTFGAFYIPMALILVLYSRIYGAARTLYQKRGSSRHLSSRSSDSQSSQPTHCRVPRSLCLSDLSDPPLSDPATPDFDERSQIYSSRERKAARILGLILGAFIACWLPFFIKELLVGLKAMQPSRKVSDFLTWLGYVNSLINPLLYTSFNEDFKQAFRRLLRIKCHT